MKKINDKITEIIETYISNGCKLWNIGTNIYNTWYRFWKSLKNNFDNFVNFTIPTKITVRKNEDKYFLIINEKIIKADVSKNKGWSNSAIRQFLQVGEALGFLIFENEKLNKISDNNEEIFDLTSSFSNVCSLSFMNNFHIYLTYSMQKALFSAATHICNFGFTLFMSLLFVEHFDESDKYILISKIMSKKIDGVTQNKFISFNTMEYQQYIEKCYKEKGTYKTCVEKIRENYLFDNLVNSLYDASTYKMIYFTFTKEEEQDELKMKKIKNAHNEIEKLRGKLKTKIEEARCENKEKWNDLENTFPKEWYIEDCEACHIFDIWRIKEKVAELIRNNKTENEINEVISFAQNPNNGLLMLEQWHYYFDRDFFNFNANGEIIILTNQNESDRLDPINYDGELNKVKIKKETFNEEMKGFLNKRI